MSVTFFHHALWLVTTRRHALASGYRVNIWNHTMFSTQCDQFEYILAVNFTKWDYKWCLAPLESSLHIQYIFKILLMMTRERTFNPQTYRKTLNCTHVHVKKSSFQGKSTTVENALFIKLSHHCLWMLYETAWCIYVFIYLSFFNLLDTVSAKKMRFWIWKSCTKCSWNKPTEMIQNANMQWLAVARMIQEEAILYFVDFF